MYEEQRVQGAPRLDSPVTRPRLSDRVVLYGVDVHRGSFLLHDGVRYNSRAQLVADDILMVICDI